MAVTIAQLRQLALDLPEATEVETWGHPTFRVHGKMFATCSQDSEEVPTATFKATKHEQAALIAAAPEVYAVAPYLGQHGWVRVTLAGVNADQFKEHLLDAWRHTAPKRLVTTSGL